MSSRPSLRSSGEVARRLAAAQAVTAEGQTISTLPPGFAGTNFCSEILESVDGRYVYAGTSAPTLVYGFPGHMLLSVNDEIVHGVPGPRQLKRADL
jgi:methionine aminopeptidase